MGKKNSRPAVGNGLGEKKNRQEKQRRGVENKSKGGGIPKKSSKKGKRSYVVAKKSEKKRKRKGNINEGKEECGSFRQQSIVSKGKIGPNKGEEGEFPQSGKGIEPGGTRDRKINSLKDNKKH